MATRRRLLRPQAIKPAQTSKTWLEAFVDYTAGECHLADNTVAAYHRDLDHFFAWLDHRNVVDLTIRDLADYATWLHERTIRVRAAYPSGVTFMPPKGSPAAASNPARAPGKVRSGRCRRSYV